MLRRIPRSPRKITSRELNEYLATVGHVISKRTIERDLMTLSSVFPLSLDDRDKPYGWSWQKDAPAFDLPGLTSSEAMTFKLAEQYLLKLMPNMMVQQLQPYFKAAGHVLSLQEKSANLASWHEKIAVVLPTQPLLPPKIDSTISASVDHALLEELQLSVVYLSRGEANPKSLTLHPLGIIIRGQISYLCCTVFDYDEIRLIAIHRIQSANILDIQAKRPNDFKLNLYANSGALGFGSNELIDISLRFTKEAGMHLYETPLCENQEIIDDGDFLIVKASVYDTPQLKWWINGFGESVVKV